MSIESWTSAINQLAETGPADLKLSTETRDSYLRIVTELRDSLAERVAEAEQLGDFGQPGGYASAQQTKANLELTVANFKKSVNDYITYLDAFTDTVKKACDRALEAG